MTESVVSPTEAAVPLDPHFTILLLPGGGADTEGMSPETAGGLDEIRAAWHVPRSQAVHLDRSVRVSVGWPDGVVEAYLLTPDGTASPAARHPRRLPAEPVDPRWMDGMPDRHDLLGVVRAADRAGQWHGALVAAERLTLQLEVDLGNDHPHVIQAVELQGHFALRAQDWTAAARLLCSAAAGRYGQGAPAADTSRALANAVSSWMRARSHRGAFTTGLDLAHLLVRAAPEPRGRLVAVLGGLEGAAR
ncbi:hypothetical protein ACTVZO_40340 [Streptomyces sp. IBSNAI002]|uniref:hypothetical protein n=1 Tax=Streptomyces sp. IBSNAI002 TaxID=3457500 RepID=UPI003FCF53A6